MQHLYYRYLNMFLNSISQGLWYRPKSGSTGQKCGSAKLWQLYADPDYLHFSHWSWIRPLSQNTDPDTWAKKDKMRIRNVFICNIFYNAVPVAEAPAETDVEGGRVVERGQREVPQYSICSLHTIELNSWGMGMSIDRTQLYVCYQQHQWGHMEGWEAR